MKKSLLLIIGIGMLWGGFRSLERTSESTTPAKRVPIVKPKAVKAKPKKIVSKKLPTKAKATPKRVIIKTKSQAYNLSLGKLEKMVQSYGLDMRELTKQALANGFDKFTSDLPVPLQVQFKKVNAMARRLQDDFLAQDGMTREDIKPLKILKPAWVQNRENKLLTMNLQTTVRKLVETLKQQNDVATKDLGELINLCEKQRDCVEKAVYELINANHMLSPTQYNYIKSANLI